MHLLLFHWLNLCIVYGRFFNKLRTTSIRYWFPFLINLFKSNSLHCSSKIFQLFCNFFYIGFHAETMYSCNVIWYWLIFVKQKLQNCSTGSFDLIERYNKVKMSIFQHTRRLTIKRICFILIQFFTA